MDGTPNTKNPDYWNGGDICWATLVDTKNKYLYDTERKITQEGLNNSSCRFITNQHRNFFKSGDNWRCQYCKGANSYQSRV